MESLGDRSTISGAILLALLGGMFSGVTLVLASSVIVGVILLCKRMDRHQDVGSLHVEWRQRAEELFKLALPLLLFTTVFYLAKALPLEPKNTWILPAEEGAAVPLYGFTVVVDNFQVVCSFSLILACIVLLLRSYDAKLADRFLGLSKYGTPISLILDILIVVSTPDGIARLQYILDPGYSVYAVVYLIATFASTIAFWDLGAKLLNASGLTLMLAGLSGLVGSVYPQILGWLMLWLGSQAWKVFLYPGLVTLVCTRFTKYLGAGILGWKGSGFFQKLAERHTDVALLFVVIMPLVFLLVVSPEITAAMTPYQPAVGVPLVEVSISPFLEDNRSVNVFIYIFNPCDQQFERGLINITLVRWTDWAGRNYTSSSPILITSENVAPCSFLEYEREILFISEDPRDVTITIEITTHEYGKMAVTVTISPIEHVPPNS